mmetsp:Transcript_76846/g.166312  ORF Transcript_76846/g.166312 Transcript_76846/m.166312 type:complete len:80 (+) Transcript_76846:623-862(+)
MMQLKEQNSKLDTMVKRNKLYFTNELNTSAFHKIDSNGRHPNNMSNINMHSGTRRYKLKKDDDSTSIHSASMMGSTNLK